MTSTVIMVDINNVADDYLSITTDGHLNTSACTYINGMDQDGTDESLHYNTTDMSLFFLNATTDEETTQDKMNTDEDEVFSFTIGIFMWILSPFILTANSLTIIVVMKSIKKVTPTHVVIAFLAFAGLFVGMIPLLSLIFYLVGDSVNSEYTNDLKVWLYWTARTLNVSAIMLVAVERCFLVTSWKLYLKCLTVRRQVGLCIAFCVYSFLFATIFALMADSELEHQQRISHHLILQRNVVFLTRFLLLPFYSIKTCILAFCYLTIFVFLWKHRKAVTSSQNSSSQQNFKKEKKTTVLMLIIITLYMIGTFLPLVHALIAQKYPKLWKIELFKSINLVWYAISLLDTFIYAWKVPEFNKEYRKILCCLRRSRIIQVVSASNVQPRGINLPLEPRR